jgi:hypothetical protein
VGQIFVLFPALFRCELRPQLTIQVFSMYAVVVGYALVTADLSCLFGDAGSQFNFQFEYKKPGGYDMLRIVFMH